MRQTVVIKALCGVGLAGLVACGPLQNGNPVAGIAKGLIPSGGGEGADSAPAQQSAALTRDFIEAQESDLLLVSIIDRDATAVLLKAATNGSRVTWLTTDGSGLVLDRGMFVGSRGLGDDLMGADISGARASLRSGGNHLRVLDFLDGLDQIQRQSFQCSTQAVRTDNITIFERSYNTTVFEETCRGDLAEFKNTYWRDSAGVIWQSEQWISAQVGYVQYQRL